MTLRPEMARASHIFRSHFCNTRAGLQENSDVKADMAKRHEMYSRDLGRLREELASVTDARTSLEATVARMREEQGELQEVRVWSGCVAMPVLQSMCLECMRSRRLSRL